MLTDPYYPGWRAFVDGEETPILRADYLFRAIALPPGSHEVRFVFAPPSLQRGAILSAAGRHFATSVTDLRYLEGSYDRYLVWETLSWDETTLGRGGWAPILIGSGLGVATLVVWARAARTPVAIRAAALA